MEIILSPEMAALDPDDQMALQKLSDDVHKIFIRRKISGGLSGARVWLVDLEYEHKVGGAYIAKIQGPDWGRRELKGYEDAIRSHFGRFMPQLISNPPVRVGKNWLMIFDIAKGTIRETLPLGDLIHSNIVQVSPQIVALLDLLWADGKFSQPQCSKPIDALHDILGTLLKGKSSIAIRAQSKFGVGSQASQLIFAGDTEVLPNPITYVENTELWGNSAQLIWPSGPTHYSGPTNSDTKTGMAKVH